MRRPKKGEIVLYFPQPDEDDALANTITGGIPAMVIQVWNNELVNLRVFTDSDEPPLWRTSVQKLNEPDLEQMAPVETAAHYIRRGWIFQD